MIDAGASPVWDCHVHLFGPFDKFPLDPARLYTPEAAPFEALEAHLARVGAGNVTLVQPSPYGADHRCLIDALERMAGRARGVAAWSVGATVPAHPRIAGLRVHARACADPKAAFAAAARMATDRGLHLEVQIGPNALAGIAAALADAPCRLVLDHMAGLGAPSDDAAQLELERLLATGRVWVKYAAPYRTPGGLEAAVTLATWIDARFPDRLMWGSDWPHTPPHRVADDERLRPRAFRAVDAQAFALRMLEPFAGRARAAILGGTAETLYAAGQG